jgi:hypothetical protein
MQLHMTGLTVPLCNAAVELGKVDCAFANPLYRRKPTWAVVWSLFTNRLLFDLTERV